jgi:hypothetical protein
MMVLIGRCIVAAKPTADCAPSCLSSILLAIMWGLDPVVAHYKPTEPKPMNPLQKFAMYLTQVRNWSSIPVADTDLTLALLGVTGLLGACGTWHYSVGCFR